MNIGNRMILKGYECFLPHQGRFTKIEDILRNPNQNIFSDSLFTASITDNDGKSGFYLPEGVWTNFITGKEYKGGTWVEEQPCYLSLPLMVRENSIIAIREYCSAAGQDRAYNCELRIYAIHDGIKINAKIFSAIRNTSDTENDTAILCVTAKRHGHTIYITADGDKPYTLRMINMHAISALNGFVAVDGRDSIVTPDIGANVIEVMF